MNQYPVIFQIHFSSYTAVPLQSQVSRALEKRTEIISRQTLPGIWKLTDHINGKSASAAVTQKERPVSTTLFSLICLALGIFLFVPGLVRPQELLVPLVVGAIAVGAGIGGLVRARRQKRHASGRATQTQKESRFDLSARMLLDQIAKKSKLTPHAVIQVIFTEQGMRISDPDPASDEPPISVLYHEFDCVAETEDIFLITYRQQVLLLPKQDLTTGSPELLKEVFSAHKIICHKVF